AAGREYVKWAGLDRSYYDRLVAANASESDLKSFLSAEPSPLGWCNYRSPSPYASEYTGWKHNACYASATGTGLGGLLYSTPDYDQSVKWGAATVNQELFNTAGLAVTMSQIVVGATFGAAVGASVAVGATGAALASSSAVTSAIGATALAAAMF